MSENYIDEDMLMAMLESIGSKLDSIESEVSSIKTWMPDTDYIEEKLDKAIELLEKLVEKQS